MIDIDEVMAGLKKMLRQIDRDIGVSAAIRDEAMRENAEWRRKIINGAVTLLESIAAKP